MAPKCLGFREKVALLLCFSGRETTPAQASTIIHSGPVNRCHRPVPMAIHGPYVRVCSWDEVVKKVHVVYVVAIKQTVVSYLYIYIFIYLSIYLFINIICGCLASLFGDFRKEGVSPAIHGPWSMWTPWTITQGDSLQAAVPSERSAHLGSWGI